MYIHSVRLTNYKSIGDYKESEIIIEPQITAIIGKNESGKSKVLEGLSCINLLNYNDVVYTPAVVNRNCPTGTQNERSRKIVKFSFGLSKKSHDQFVAFLL